MPSKTTLHRPLLGAAAALLVAACASTPAPKELVSARAAYARAESGIASQLTPVAVREARVALDAAERAYIDEAEGARARDLAYVAERKAELAEARAGIAKAELRKSEAEGAREALQAKELARARGELADAESTLESTRDRAISTATALDEAERARKAAEKRAADALDKLAVAAALAVEQDARGTVITIPEGVLFAFGKYALLPAAAGKLDQVATALRSQDAEAKMVVEGHTDAVGTDDLNQALSEKRANAVRDYLVSKGLPASQILAIGAGEKRPVADNTTPEGRAQNRRVEIVVSHLERR